MRSDAACTPFPDMFLSAHASDIKQSKAICAQCPIREACLADVLEMEDQLGGAIKGTVAGTTEQDRVQIHAKRVA